MARMARNAKSHAATKQQENRGRASDAQSQRSRGCGNNKLTGRSPPLRGHAHPWQLIWKLPSRADEGSVVAPTFVCQDLIPSLQLGLGAEWRRLRSGVMWGQSQHLAKADFLPNPRQSVDTSSRADLGPPAPDKAINRLD